MSGIDCATRLDAVSATCLFRQGQTFALRYFDDSFGLSPKSLTEQECQAILSAGLELLPVYETTADRAQGGRNAGMEDAGFALAAARTTGYPVNLPIFFAVDYDAALADLLTIVEYFNGAYDVLKDQHPLGVYGPWDVIDQAAKFWPAVPYRWQAYAPAWSQGRNAARHPLAHIIQVPGGGVRCGISVDLNEKQMVAGLEIVGWKQGGDFVSRAEFEAYKVALQKELDDNYVRKVTP